MIGVTLPDANFRRAICEVRGIFDGYGECNRNFMMFNPIAQISEKPKAALSLAR
jgi:hypothetical protein